MFTKPPTLKSPSIRQSIQFNNVQKQKTKTSPTTTLIITAKPNTLKTTLNPTPLHQSSSKNSPNINTSASSINMIINKQSFASTVANSLIPKKRPSIINRYRRQRPTQRLHHHYQQFTTTV